MSNNVSFYNGLKRISFTAYYYLATTICFILTIFGKLSKVLGELDRDACL